MFRFPLHLASVAVLTLTLAIGCRPGDDPASVDEALAPSVIQEAWRGLLESGTERRGRVHASARRTITQQSDSVEYLVYLVREESGRADGVLTISNDTTLAYDPYEVIVSGFFHEAHSSLLLEYARYDGTRCRMKGSVDSLGIMDAAVGCGGVFVDSVTMRPIQTGFVAGTVSSDGDAAEGVRVWRCVIENSRLSQCEGVTYSGPGGLFRFESPPGEWFITFSIWDPIFDEWEYCRQTLSSTSTLGRTVTVELGRVTSASVDCPWFN